MIVRVWRDEVIFFIVLELIEKNVPMMFLIATPNLNHLTFLFESFSWVKIKLNGFSDAHKFCVIPTLLVIVTSTLM